MKTPTGHLENQKSMVLLVPVQPVFWERFPEELGISPRDA